MNESWQTVYHKKQPQKPQRYQFCSSFNDATKEVNLILLDLKSGTEMNFKLEDLMQYDKLKTIWNSVIKSNGFVNDEYKILISDKYLVSNDELNIKFIKRQTGFTHSQPLLSVSFGLNGHVSTYFKLA